MSVFLCVCCLIDDKLHHNIVKVAEPQASGSAVNLLSVNKDKWFIQNDTNNVNTCSFPSFLIGYLKKSITSLWLKSWTWKLALIKMLSFCTPIDHKNEPIGVQEFSITCLCCFILQRTFQEEILRELHSYLTLHWRLFLWWATSHRWETALVFPKVIGLKNLMPPTVFDQSGNTKVNSPIGHVRFSTLGFVRIFFAFSLVRCVVYFYFDWPPWLPWFQLHDRLDYQPLFECASGQVKL